MPSRRYGRVHPAWPATIPDCPLLVSPTEGSETTVDALLVVATIGTPPESVTIFYKKVGDAEYTELEAVLDETIDGVSTWIGTPDEELENSESYEYYAVATRNGNTSVGCVANLVTFSIEGVNYAPTLKPLIQNYWPLDTDLDDDAFGHCVFSLFGTPTPSVTMDPDGHGKVSLTETPSSNQVLSFVGTNHDIVGFGPPLIGPQFGWTVGMTLEFDTVPDFTSGGDSNFYGDYVPFAGISTNNVTSGITTGAGFALQRVSGQVYLAAVAGSVVVRMNTPLQAGRKYKLANIYNRSLSRIELYVDCVLENTGVLASNNAMLLDELGARFRIGALAASDQPVTFHVRDIFAAIDGISQAELEWLYNGTEHLRPYSDIKSYQYTETYEEWVQTWFKDYVPYASDTTNIGNAGRADPTLLSTNGGAAPAVDTSNTTPLPGPLAGDGYLYFAEDLSYAQYQAIDMTGGGVFGTAFFGYDISGFSAEDHAMIWAQRYANTPLTPSSRYSNCRLWTLHSVPLHVSMSPSGTFNLGNRLYPATSGFTSGFMPADTWQHYVSIVAPPANNSFNGQFVYYGLTNGALTCGDQVNTIEGYGAAVNYTHVLSGDATGAGGGFKLAHVGNIFGGNTVPHPSYFTKLWQILTGY